MGLNLFQNLLIVLGKFVVNKQLTNIAFRIWGHVEIVLIYLPTHCLNARQKLNCGFFCRTVINSGKICVLNLQAASLKILHESDLKPYVVFLAPPSLQTYKQQKAKYGEQFRVRNCDVRFYKTWAIPVLFFFVFFFSTVNKIYVDNKKVANVWIRIADLWYQKQLLCQR